MSTPENPSRRQKLSRFLSQEMLYDFLMEKLDPNRREAVQESLANDENVREAYENLREGLDYAQKLRSVTPSRPLVEKLLVAETQSRALARKLSFKELPATLRLTIEAFFVSATVAAIVIFLPWGHLRHFLQKDRSESIEIATVVNPRGTAEGSIPDTPSGDLESPTSSTGAENVANNEPKTQPVGKPTAVAKVDKNAAKKDKSTVVANAADEKPMSMDASGSVNTEVLTEKTQSILDQRKVGNLKGFVYRSFLKIRDVDGATPKIVDAIKQLGGTKAGEVELGWRRGNKSYMHFSLPEINYDAAVKSLQTFGVVRIYREPHRRVMPEGQVRFILWVEPVDE